MQTAVGEESHERSRLLAEGFVPVPLSLAPEGIADVGGLPVQWGGRAIALEIAVPMPAANATELVPTLVGVFVQQGPGATKPTPVCAIPLSTAQKSFLRELGQRLGREWAQVMTDGSAT